MNKLRLDKWLWAARFYKTRSLAKQAIEGGKVRFERGRVKVSKEIQLGDLLTVRQGLDEKTIEVLQLSDRRRGAPEAQMLYRETEPSIKLREERAAQRKLESSNRVWPEQRPTKKQRRQIHRFKQDTE
jgi:ribosome-associated heat shock protein Hsp15